MEMNSNEFRAHCISIALNICGQNCQMKGPSEGVGTNADGSVRMVMPQIRVADVVEFANALITGVK